MIDEIIQQHNINVLMKITLSCITPCWQICYGYTGLVANKKENRAVIIELLSLGVDQIHELCHHLGKLFGVCVLSSNLFFN